MMPAIYGNSYQIQQGPGVVTITYEMVHDTRVIPLDGRPHVVSSVRQYLGDARGRWEGHTLVVETTNFTDKTPYRGSSDQLRMIERFTPLGPDTLEWSVTFDDPHTWAKPWTFAMNLTKGREPAAVRVRVSRGELRTAEHPCGGARRREEMRSLLILVACAGSVALAQGSADTVVTNGKILTVDADFRIVQAWQSITAASWHAARAKTSRATWVPRPGSSMLPVRP